MSPKFCPLIKGPCVGHECNFFNQKNSVCAIREALIAISSVPGALNTVVEKINKTNETLWEIAADVSIVSNNMP